ncbi:two-component system osmolarity sensor histidine kinase EnvZ [Endobacter medicaginis]|uniref:histidine kinase n=3 Tax=Endobacter medicaginis TaxID=1181271 RepID=A0A839UYQ3_9PROT|nr:ATP-binding protein [Endobacter medicaginis]MBB3173464.1 two-component system osmolarity sensor histidine kinase EnvZ [Endobacter medicaginis]MCX5475501.1 ATP-binding protein [Endobacter medicaginis]
MRLGIGGFNLGQKVERPLRRVLPRSLLGRSLLIVLIPLVATQAVALFLYYGAHLNLLSRRLSSAVAGEIMQTIVLLEHDHDPRDRAETLLRAQDNFQLSMRIRPGATLVPLRRSNIIGPMDDDLASALRQTIARPFTMDWVSDPHTVQLHIQLHDGVLDVDAPRKRLDTEPLYLFVAWVAGSSVLFAAVASLFMRNQVRAIRRLARAAENFGIGRDDGPIKPEGAQEVRKAASAFNRMRERLIRFVAQRTDLLAGVSHDLRTPLTRMRLTLAMLPQQGTIEAADLAPDIAGLVDDVEEMERMVGGYLAFARGEGAEAAQLTDLAAMVQEIAVGARRAGAAQVVVEAPRSLPIVLRADAVRRALTNLVDNARRHAAHVTLRLTALNRQALLFVDDDGPGVPQARREAIFRAFEAGAGGGTGLGLAIARDILRAHGGEVTIETSPEGGARARVFLPL